MPSIFPFEVLSDFLGIFKESSSLPLFGIDNHPIDTNLEYGGAVGYVSSMWVREFDIHRMHP